MLLLIGLTWIRISSSLFAHKISLAVADFAELFVQANCREHDSLLDGFVMSPDGLVEIAFKFQHRYALLLTSVQALDVVQFLSPYQKVTYQANHARGAACGGGYLVTCRPGGVGCGF